MASRTTASMSTSSSKKKAPRYHKTLASLFRHFVGMQLTVELKTGRLYEGILAESDDFGNLTLENADEPTGGRRSDKSDFASSSTKPTIITQPPRFASMHIRGPTIRYIHFPPHADLSALIRKGIDRERAAAQAYSRGKRK